MYGKLRRAFNAENIELYLNDILGNKARMNKLPPLDPLKKVDAYVMPESIEQGDDEGSCGPDSCTAPHNDDENDL